MARICPKCNYYRQPSDENPEWQCPSCGVAYNKVDAASVAAANQLYRAAAAHVEPASSGLVRWIVIALVLGAGIWIAKPVWQPKKAQRMVSAATAQPSVVLYSTSWCGYCKATRAFFSANNIAYVDLDVEKSTEGYEAYKKLGGHGVPLIVVDDEVIHGFSEGKMRAVLKLKERESGSSNGA